MKLHPRLLAAISATAAVATLLGVAYLLVGEPWRQRQPLPDGSTLTLWGATYGKQHQFDDRQGWRRLVAAVKPTPAPSPWLATGPVFTHSTDSDALVAWVGHTGRSSSDGGGVFPAAVLDEHGCSFGYPPRSDRTGHGLSGWAGQLSAFPIPAFNRRGRSVTLQFRDTGTGEPRARFTLPNPVEISYPTWQAEPYPIARQSGSTRFILKSLDTVDRGNWHGVIGAYTIAEAGQPSENWRPLHATVSDATGNSVRSPVPEYLPYGVCPVPNLCRHEAAWKLRLAFAPVDADKTPPDQLWRVQGIAAPPPAGATPRSDVHRRSGLTLNFDGVLGVSTARQRVWFPRKPFAVASVTASGDGLRLTLVKATDEQGRTLLPPRGSGLARGLEGAATQAYWLPRQTHHFGLVIPPDAKKLNLTFAIHRARVVDFLARP